MELARKVIARRADQVDLVVVGGDWNASTTGRPRVGYVGSQVTRGADALLQGWYRGKDLTCAVPEHETWQSLHTHMGQEFVKNFKVLTSGKLTVRKKFSAKVKDCVASLRFLITSQDMRTKKGNSRLWS